MEYRVASMENQENLMTYNKRQPGLTGCESAVWGSPLFAPPSDSCGLGTPRGGPPPVICQGSAAFGLDRLCGDGDVNLAAISNAPKMKYMTLGPKF